MARTREPQRPKTQGAAEPARDRAETRARRLLFALASLYALALALMYAFGVFAFVWKTAVVPALFIVAYAAGRFRPFVRDWAVFLAAIALFDSLRGLVYGAICRYSLREYMGYAIAAEEALFGSPPPSARIQAHWFAPESIGALERLLVSLHASHFLVFLFFGLWLWLARPRAFARFRAAMLLAIYAALIGYIAVPTVPPWLAAGRYHVIAPVAHVPARLYGLTIPSLARSFDLNPVAAMPSLHAAFPALLVCFAAEDLGAVAVALFGYALAVWFAIVALGEHYVVDVLAGVALATFAYFAARRFVGDTEPSAHPSTASLARTLLAAAVLLALAQAAGLTARAWAGDPRPTEAFIRAELDGKSSTAAFYRAQNAFAAGDYARAEALFSQAKSELPSIAEQREAYARLGESAYRARDFATAVATFASQPELTPAQSLMLAESRLAIGQRALGFALLDELRAQRPIDPQLNARVSALERAYRR